MDEITITTETCVAEVTSTGVTISTITPEEFGITRCSMADLRGGDATANADIVRSVLRGEKGPKRDVILLNSAFGLMVAGRTSTVQGGMLLAAEAIDSGKAMAQLEQLIIMTRY